MNFYKLVLCTGGALLLSACGSSSEDPKIAFTESSYSIAIDEDNSASTTLSVVNASNSATYSVINAPSEGVVNINARTGLLTYTPPANFNGLVEFQVSVSDGSTTSSAQVSITINPVNDLPELANSLILVSGGQIKQGQVIASDVDGDTLLYTVLTSTTKGSLSIDASSGMFSYIPNELSLIDDSFEIEISDGQGGIITEVINIQANTASNTDRAFYYYASDTSHLKRAQNLGLNLNSDVNLSLLNQDIVEGYASAGLTTQVDALLNANNIVLENVRANTMVNVASIYDQLDLNEEAENLRDLANVIYNQYVASKGLSAFNSDDVLFYDNLASSYQAAGNVQGANQALSILDLLFTSLAADGYSTAILRTMFAYRDIVSANVSAWQESQEPALRDLVMAQTARLYRYANIIPARLVRNNRNGNEGEFFHSIRQVVLFDVTDYYISLKEFELGKSVMADVLALHGVVNYDPAFPRQAHEFAAVTKVEYESGMTMAAPYFVNLYPDAGVDTLLSGLPDTSVRKNRVRSDAQDALLMAEVRNAQNKLQALQNMIDNQDANDLRGHFTNIVAFNSRKPGAARILRNLGEFDAALAFLQEGLNVISSSVYFQQNRDIVEFVLGGSGCGMIINEALAIVNINGSDDAFALAQNTATICAQIVEQYYTLGNDADAFTVSDAIDANAALLVYLSALDLSAEKDTLLSNINNNLALVSDIPADLVDFNKKVGIKLAQGGELVLALDYYRQAIVALNIIEGNAIPEEVGSQTSDLFDGSRSSSTYSDLLFEIESLAGIHDDYSAVLAAAKSEWLALISQRVSDLQNANLLQQAEYLPEYANQYIRLGSFDSALVLARSDALGPVEKQSIITETASALAALDMFISTNLASVDTDQDGMPNFFLATASAQEIAQSKLVLDTDSDNDGVDDGEDNFPLDPSRQ